MQSEQIDQLITALSKAQGEMRQPVKNKTVTVRPKTAPAYTFDYADLSEILDCIRAPFAKHGLSATSQVEVTKDDLRVTAKISHSSGQWMGSQWPLPNTDDPKLLGGAVTYGKRYLITGLVNIAADDDVDAGPGDVVEEFKPRQTPTKEALKPSGSAPKISIKSSPGPSTGDTNYTHKAATNPSPAVEKFKLVTAAMKKNAWDESDVSSFMMKRYGKTFKELDPEEIAGLISTIESLSPFDAVNQLPMFSDDSAL